MAKKLSIAQRMSRDIPVVKGYLSESLNSKSSWRVFRFWCPWCRKFHRHGFPSAAKYNRHKKYSEHRVAHCFNDSPFKESGYFLQPFTMKEKAEILEALTTGDEATTKPK